MALQSFSLVPFEPYGSISELAIGGCVWRKGLEISVGFEVSGPLSQVYLPVPNPFPRRKANLWEDTCFEIFIGISGQARYWEFNLSPSGDWNVFGFLDYRNPGKIGSLNEALFPSKLPFRTFKQSDLFSLDLQWRLDEVADENDALDIGVSAVIRYNDANGLVKPAYYALGHSGDTPDFHKRKHFILTL